MGIRRSNIPIVQISENGAIMQEYKSSAQAGKILGICRKKIHRAVNEYAGKQNPTGLLFMTKDQYNQVINN